MSAANKILNSDPSDFELKVAQALVELEVSSPQLKADLALFQFQSAREVSIGEGKTAILIFVPEQQLKYIHSVQQKQQRLTRELEKKFSDRCIFFLADRVIPQEAELKHHALRTFSPLENAVLEDIVFPTDIVGRRIRFQAGGNKIFKVYLDPKEASTVGSKIDAFEAVYNTLTGKNVTFEIGTQSEVTKA